MATGIHTHIEVKAGCIWHHYAAPSMFQNSIFFDLLGGISDRYQPIVPPRGLPKDLTFVTQHDWNQDSKSYSALHHAGWLSADELEELQRRLNDIYRNSLLNKMDYDLETTFLHTFINGNTLAQHQGWDDLRLIFWFDD